VAFPKSWKWFMDQKLTQWVKDHYSPRPSWKGKPFNEDDAHFFFKGIDELSEIFTQDRGRALQRYFEHPRFRSGYLLYFLPLQAAKFIAVFERHSAFLLKALHAASQKGTLHIVDLGAGPLTASIAFILWIQDHLETIPEIHVTAVDSQSTILKEGALLLEALTQGFPKLRGKVRIETQVQRWQDWARHHAKSNDNADFYLLGHVLNEARDHQAEAIAQLFEKNPRVGVLAIEPAAKNTSQSLSQLRDLLLEEFALTPVGPCPHRERCPLSSGGDWCHFSFPAEIPGGWFAKFSKGLGSERQWLKLSYLWLADSGFVKKEESLPSAHARLLVSDALNRPSGQKQRTSVEALACHPDRVEKIWLKIPLQKLRGPLALRGGFALDSAGPPKGTSRKWQASKDRR
jgi:hypothetical protein